MRNCAAKGECKDTDGVRYYINDIYEGYPKAIGRLVNDSVEADCVMDIHNNNIGFECAEKAGKSCAECCYSKRTSWIYYGPEPTN